MVTTSAPQAKSAPPNKARASTQDCYVDGADFDLRAIVRQELAASSNPDPHSIVEAVFARIPRNRYVEVIHYLLHSAVRQWSTAERVLPEDLPTPGPSRWSRSKIYLNGEDQRWEFLGKMTADELRLAAELRRSLAAANIAVAVRFERLAEMLEQRQVRTVDELDAAEVRQVMA